MRCGSLTRSIVCRPSLLFATVVLTACPSLALAQALGYNEPSAQPRATRQALFTTPVSSMFAKQKTPYVDAYGNPVVVPANYGQPCECSDGYHGRRTVRLRWIRLQ